MFVIVCCDPDERGADSVCAVYLVGDNLAETLDILAEMREDDPYGKGWAYMEVQEV